MSDRITPRKRKAIHYLVQGISVTDVSALLGVSARQVFRWLNDPVFVNELNSLQLKETEYISRRLVNLVGEAVDTLESVLKDPAQPGASVMVRASLGIIESSHRWKDQVDFDNRLTALERKLANER